MLFFIIVLSILTSNNVETNKEVEITPVHRLEQKLPGLDISDGVPVLWQQKKRRKDDTERH